MFLFREASCAKSYSRRVLNIQLSDPSSDFISEMSPVLMHTCINLYDFLL